MKYLKNRQEFLTGVIEYKESYQYKSQDLVSSTLVREVLENDITWGGSLLGRLINSTIRKAVIGTKVLRINPLIKKLKAQLESIESEYLGKEKEIAQQAIIYALFEAIKKAAIRPEPLDIFLKSGGLIDQLIYELDEVDEFPSKDELKTKIEQFRKDLEELKKGGDVEIEVDEDDEDDNIDELKEKFRVSIVKVLESVISIHNILNKKAKSEDTIEITPEEKKFKVGNVYIYTNKKGEKKKAKLVSFTNQVSTGNDKQFVTKDDVNKDELSNPSSVFVEFLDDDNNSLPNKPAMAVDISTLSIDSGTDDTGGAKKVKNKVPTVESFIFESVDDPRVSSAYNNLVKYDRSSNVKSYVNILQSMIEGSKSDQKVGFNWAGISWPTEGTINNKIISFGKQLLGNLKTSGKPLESNELIAESAQFNDVAKSVSLFCRPVLGFESSPDLIKMMGETSELIQSIIDSFESMGNILPKISEKPKTENLVSSYNDFIKINEADEDNNDTTDDNESENLVKKAYRKNFSEEDENIWIANKDKKSSMESKFKNIKINIDTNSNVDPIVRIANIFGDAYKIFATPQIPSGRPNGRISQRTWREYKYIGGKGTGDWQPDRAPNGPFASKSIFNKWEKGVMSIIEDQSLRKIFANPNLSINGNPGAGQTLFKFMNDMLEDDTLKDYDGARRKLLLKYFNISEDKADIRPAQATIEGKEIPKEEVVPNQTVLSELTPFNISKADIDDHSYLLLNYESEDKKYLMVMYIMGIFTDNDNKKILAFKYQVGFKDLFKYLDSKQLKSPDQDIIKNLKENGPINIGFFDGTSMKKTFNIKTQELNDFINKVELKDKEIKIIKGFTLNVSTKDKKNKDIMKIVKIEAGKDIISNKMRPKSDKNIGLSDIKTNYNNK